jgi:hypothetical protein
VGYYKARRLRGVDLGGRKEIGRTSAIISKRMRPNFPRAAKVRDVSHYCEIMFRSSPNGLGIAKIYSRNSTCQAGKQISVLPAPHTSWLGALFAPAVYARLNSRLRNIAEESKSYDYPTSISKNTPLARR